MTFFHYFLAYNQLPKWLPQLTKHPVFSERASLFRLRYSELIISSKSRDVVL